MVDFLTQYNPDTVLILGSSVLAYYFDPIREIVDFLQSLRSGRRSGKRVYLPVVVSDEAGYGSLN